MQTTDTDLLFQSNQQLADSATRERKVAAAEKIGNPIKVSSKVLDLLVEGGDAWTAESGWQARRLDLNTGRTKMLYKGHKGPVTSVALYAVGGDKPWLALITGSWDKTARVWDAETGELVTILEGHSDFVKSVTVLPTSPATLVTTSSDKSLRLWDLQPLERREAPKTFQIVKEHSRPVETAAYAVPEDAEGRVGDTITVWTADSMGVIKEWTIGRTLPSQLTFVRDLPGHETSIAGLAAVDEGLWSVSMDNTARLHADKPITLPHPTYVKSILVSPHGLPYILTGSEDEEIRVWDASALDDASPKPLSVVSGHCGQVSAMAGWVKEAGGKREVHVVSAGLDGTLRRWTVPELLNPPKLVYEPVKPPGDMTLTAEEEAELAELLSDED